ncbi:MAG: anti-sigma factor antagonist [Calditrichaeota bacterium]|nr:MAG: anti-sigma factor antagonist [Calditrichota bacterium]
MKQEPSALESSNTNDEIKVIRVGGYIDITTADEIEKVLKSLISAGCYNIVIDLENVDYISSAGWGIFISQIKEIRDNGGDLKLARMKPEVYEVFDVLEFFWIFKAYDSVDEAIEDFNSQTDEYSQAE